MQDIVLSHSAIMCFLNNQIQFKKRYITKVYDDPKNPSMVVGSAIHKMIEFRLNGKPVEEALQAGIEEIDNVADYEIDYGKTGSREKMLKDYEALAKAVITELPAYTNLVDIEAKLQADVSISGKKVPLKGRLDLVRDLGDGTLEIRDWKTVTSYSDENTENYKYVFQAWIYTVLAELEYRSRFTPLVTMGDLRTLPNFVGSPLRSYGPSLGQLPRNHCIQSYCKERADNRSAQGNCCISEIGAAFSFDRKNCMCQTRSNVTCRIDGISGKSA